MSIIVTESSNGMGNIVGFRILNKMEKQSMTTEAQGYLIKLAQSGIVHPQELETILERLMQESYYLITVEDVVYTSSIVMNESLPEITTSIRMLNPSDIPN